VSDRVYIFDTTLRDGEQSPGCSMTVMEKQRMAYQLERLGVDIIEAGFPISSDGDFQAVQAVARDVRRPTIAALARCRREDIQRAWEAVRNAARPRIHTFLATSDIHLEHKLRISRRDCLEQARDAVKFARSLCADVEFSAEDATRTDVALLCEVLESVIEAGATTVNIPDTVGYSVPAEYGELFQALRRRVRGIEGVVVSAHCHNDLGLAVANSLAAVAAGARQVECTINGIGERAGNASLEEIVMVLRVRRDRHPYSTMINSEHLFPASQLLTDVTGTVVQPNKAIIGRNAFAHEAGIHQDGMIKNPLTYEIMTPESVGVPSTRLVLGKHSGRHALRLRCEQLGFQLDRHDLDHVYRLFLALADRVKAVDDSRLRELVRQAQAASQSEEPVERKHPIPTPALPAFFGAGRIPPAAVGTSHEGDQEDYLWGV